MLPRRPESTINNPINKPTSLKPASLLSFGIRTLPKDNLSSRNPKIVHEKPQPKTAHNSQKNRKQNNNHLLLNLPDTHLAQSSNRNRYQTQNQNLVFKKCQPNTKTLLRDFSTQQRTFSDQIGQRPNILKLSNITNICSDQAQNFLNVDKKHSLLFQTPEFLQDRLFNQGNQSQIQRIYIDMKKKIKKLSKSKRLSHQLHTNPISNEETKIHLESNGRKEMTALHQNLMKAAYADNQVIFNDSIFRCKLINQRIDNDVDTDQEQITSGIKRLQKSLEQAVEQIKRQAIQSSSIMQDCQLEESSLDKQSCFFERQFC